MDTDPIMYYVVLIVVVLLILCILNLYGHVFKPYYAVAHSIPTPQFARIGGATGPAGPTGPTGTAGVTGPAGPGVGSARHLRGSRPPSTPP